MKIFSLCLVTILVVKVSFCQLDAYQWSTTISKSTSEEVAGIHELEEKKTAVVRWDENNHKDISIDIFDSLFNAVNSEHTNVPIEKIIHVGTFDGHLSIVGWNKNAEKKSQDVSIYNFNQEGVLTNTMLLVSNPLKSGYQYNYSCAFSSEGNYLSLAAAHPYEKGKTETITYYLFDTEFNSLLSEDIYTDVASSKRVVNVPVIDSKGNGYIIKKYREKSETHYHIYYIAQSGSVTDTDLKSRSHKIKDIKFDINEDRLLLSGYYSSFGLQNMEGIFISRYNNSAKPVWTKEYMFSENIVTSFKSKKDIKQKGFGLDNFHAHQLVKGANDSFLLIAKQKGYTVDKDTDKTVQTSLGLTISGFTEKGGLLYSVPIVTEQVDKAGNGKWNGAVVEHGDASNFFYYNRIGPSSDKLKEDKNQNASCIIETTSIMKNGSTAITYPVFENDLENYALLPKIYFQNENKSIVITENLEGNSYKLGYKIYE